MTEQKLFKVDGTIKRLGKSENFPQRTQYQHIWLQESSERNKTVRDVIAVQELNQYLAIGKDVSLYFLVSPSGQNFLFAVDAEGNHADVIDSVGQGQAQAYRQAIKLLICSIPLCLVLVGLLLLPLTVRGLYLLRKAPKPADMRAFLAANRPAG
jgi:hypothetical protein